MAIVLKCKCGETYQTDERHLGYSIKCRNCYRIIPIAKADSNSRSYNARPNTNSSESKTIFEDISVEPKRPFFGNIVIPIAGTLALLIGIVLTVTSLRQQNNSQPTNTVLAQSSTPISTPANSLTTGSANTSNEKQKNQGVSNQSVAQANLPLQPANTADQQSNTSFESSPSPTPSPETVRYETGKNLIVPQNTGGRGTLDISNGTSTDAIAKLVDVRTSKTLQKIYIRANSNLTVKNIKVGNYFLKFSLGSGYIPETEKFQSSQSFSRFDEPFNFEEKREDSRIVWNTYSITLNKVLYGNAKSSSIDENDFEDK